MKSIIKANDLKQLTRSVPRSVVIEGDFNYVVPGGTNPYCGHNETCMINIPLGVDTSQVIVLPFQVGTTITRLIAHTHNMDNPGNIAVNSFKSYIMNIRIDSELNGRGYTRNFQTGIRTQWSTDATKVSKGKSSEVAVDSCERIFIDTYRPKSGDSTAIECTCVTRLGESMVADGSKSNTAGRLVRYSNTNSFDMRPIGDHSVAGDAIKARLDDVFMVLNIKTSPLETENFMACNTMICNMIMDLLYRAYTDESYRRGPSNYKTPILLVCLDSSVNITNLQHKLISALADSKEKYAKNAHILLSQDWMRNIDCTNKFNWVYKKGGRKA